MMKIQDLMTAPVVTVGPATKFKDIVKTMLDNDVSGLPVVDERDAPLGIVTEADLLPKEAYGGKEHRRVLRVFADLLAGHSLIAQAEGLVASDVMTERLVVAYPEEDARYAARRMVEEGVKRLPVVDDGRLVGIVSRADLLRAFDRDDAELQHALTHLLRLSHYRPPQNDIEIEVMDGIASLHGTVRLESDVRAVGAIVGGAEGVVDVRNELSFRERDPLDRR